MAKEVDDPEKAAKSDLNMTPMIDMTFQLIVVFLCSMKFRTLDMKIEAFLPKDVGLAAAPADTDVKTEVVVELKRRRGDDTTTVFLLNSRVGTTAAEGIWTALEGKLRDLAKSDTEIKAQIAADADVLHGEVMRTLDSFMAADLSNVVFKGTSLNKSGSFETPPGPSR